MAQLATIVKRVSKLNVNYIQNNVICDHCAKNQASLDCQVLNQVWNKQVMWPISIIKIMHIQKNTILFEEITQTFHGTTTKGHLDLKILRRQHMRIGLATHAKE